MSIHTAGFRKQNAEKVIMEISKINLNNENSQEHTDLLLIKPLGAGQEVGRSCIFLEYKGKKIMLDCGIHPGLSGIDSLPFVDSINPSEIDLLLITHFHLDHCGALPWFLLKTGFKGKCFMTHATKAIYPIMLTDYIKVSNLSAQQTLYNKYDIEESLNKIEAIDFHVERDVNGIRFRGYHAGHVLGAAMFLIEIDGLRILYTGDFSREEDRHLKAAEIPSLQPEVLIVEATYGTYIHEQRDEREVRFTGTAHDIVKRGGKCLIPVFALGRAQELLLILDEYWSYHPELHDIPIYYASSLAQKCMMVYQTFVNAMNDRIKQQFAINNPFVFKHVSNLKSIDHLDDTRPCVVLATPGMMQRGLSRQLFERWCTDSKNGTIVAGYCVDGTLAKDILSHPEDITTLAGETLPLEMSVDYISFSAHTDYQQTSEFIRILKPPHVVLVHGEQSEMGKLKAAIIQEYKDDPDVDIEVYNPKNAQGVELYFSGQKFAKVIGSLAVKPPILGHRLEGVLVKENFNFYLVAPSDLAKYTDVKVCTLRQKLSVPYLGRLDVLYYYLKKISWNAKLFPSFKEFGGKMVLHVYDVITIFQVSEAEVVMEWTASRINDMYADSVVATILKIKHLNLRVSDVSIMEVQKLHFTDCLERMLIDQLETKTVSNIVNDKKLIVTVDEKIVEINIQTLVVKCEEDEVLQQMVSAFVLKLHNCLNTPNKT